MPGGPLSQSELYAEDENLETRVLLRPDCNLVIIPTETLS